VESPLDVLQLRSLVAETEGSAAIRIGLVDGPVANVPALAESRIHRIDGGDGCAVTRSAACLHGTFVAGMLAAAKDSGAPSLCRGCTLVVRSIFAEDAVAGAPAASAYELAAAVRDCVEAGAQIINLSVALLGAKASAERALASALEEAQARGTLVVAAAGNEGAVGSSPLTRHPAVLPVVACDLDGRPTPESNLSSSVATRGLMAPSVGFTSIDGDGSAATLGGTSVAAPWVTATAALLWSLFPSASLAQVRAALLGPRRARSLVPPVLRAADARARLSRAGVRSMSETIQETPRQAAPLSPSPALSPVSTASTASEPSVHPASCGCAQCEAQAEHSGTPPSYVYALGRIEARFPSLAIEKEYAQAVARGRAEGKTDSKTLHDTLSERANRYLARSMCWVLSVEGIATYILKLRDPSDLELLVGALRPAPRATDVDAVVGVRGPLATPEVCNGLIVPIVAISQIYSFDVDTLIQSIPRPEKIPQAEFASASEEVFTRIQQMADNAGSLDEHRATNYLALRYPAVYATAAEAFGRNASLSAVEARPSALSGVRRVFDVILTFTHRTTGVDEKHSARVDVTEEFPFLVSRLAPYYDR
jgi:hypothetical protein